VLNNPGEAITEVTTFENVTNPVPIPPNYYFYKKIEKFISDNPSRIHGVIHSEEMILDPKIVLKHFCTSFKLS
jgi:hypothetical protein